MSRLSLQALHRALMGPAGRDRVFVSQTLLAVMVYVAFAVMQHTEVLFGLVDLRESNLLTCATISVGLTFYGLARFGISKRFSNDPALTLQHTTCGVLMAGGSYAITGPARGGAMALLLLIMAFAMFTVRPAQARRLAMFSFAVFVAVIAWKSWSDPLRYPPEVELIHGIWTGIILTAIAALAGRMGNLRQRLSQQKRELQHALEHINELAMRDELTGLYNRRHMSGLMAAEHARHRLAGSKMTIALLDIDLFKRINDNHGHHAGDQVLKTFAEIGRKVLRSGDVLARWGGEEFLLMLPGTDPQQAAPIVERLRLQMADMPLDSIAPQLRVTFSSGLAACGDDEPLDACIERADQAMYRAKTQGRNCLVLA